MTDRRDERDNEEQEALIIDLRHSRNGDEDPDEPVPADAPQPATVPAAGPDAPAEAPELIDYTSGRPAADSAPAAPGGEHSAQAEHGLGDSPEEDEQYASEMEQLRLVFAAGLSGYLKSQIGMLINFALIGLGRSPNPATGLVAADPQQARTAIDMLEFIILRLEPELRPEDLMQLRNLSSDLKLAYTQLVSGIVPDLPPKPEA